MEYVIAWMGTLAGLLAGYCAGYIHGWWRRGILAGDPPVMRTSWRRPGLPPLPTDLEVGPSSAPPTIDLSSSAARRILKDRQDRRSKVKR